MELGHTGLIQMKESIMKCEVGASWDMEVRILADLTQENPDMPSLS